MNIGIIGCGNVATRHMRVYDYLKKATVAVVSDINHDRVRNFAKQHRISRFFINHEDLLELKDLDLVDICTPTSTHVLMACDAAKYGHNILLEKPMARSTIECEKIILEARKQGVNLCVCHNQLFLPSVRQAKAMVDSGYCDLVSFRTSVKENPEQLRAPRWNMTPEEKGILWEVGCHPAYLQLYFLKEITEVYAMGNKVKYSVHDDFAVLLKTANRSYGIIEVSWLATKPEIIYEISSSDGKRVKIDRLTDSIIELPGAQETKPSEIRIITRYIKNQLLPSRKTSKSPLGYFVGHLYLINSYLKSLEKGTSPPVRPEEGKKAVKLLECIEKSLNTHKAIPVK